MDQTGHTVKNSAWKPEGLGWTHSKEFSMESWRGGGFWKEIDGAVDFGRELAGRGILSTFTKCGPRPTAILAAAKQGVYSQEYTGRGIPRALARGPSY